jgi:hypothetical protein
MIFVSYSHHDAVWLKRFETIFGPLRRYVEVDLWADTRIPPGANWRNEINEAMDAAFAAVLLDRNQRFQTQTNPGDTGSVAVEMSFSLEK